MVQRETFDTQDEGNGKEKPTLWRAVNGFPSGSKRHLVSLQNPGSELHQAQALQVDKLLTKQKAILQETVWLNQWSLTWDLLRKVLISNNIVSVSDHSLHMDLSSVVTQFSSHFTFLN